MVSYRDFVSHVTIKPTGDLKWHSDVTYEFAILRLGSWKSRNCYTISLSAQIEE